MIGIEIGKKYLNTHGVFAGQAGRVESADTETTYAFRLETGRLISVFASDLEPLPVSKRGVRIELPNGVVLTVSRTPGRPGASVVTFHPGSPGIHHSAELTENNMMRVLDVLLSTKSSNVIETLRAAMELAWDQSREAAVTDALPFGAGYEERANPYRELGKTWVTS